MAPINLVRRKRRLLVHLKGERIMDLAFGGDRQGHGFCKHIGLPQAKHPAPAVAPEIDADAVDLTGKRSQRLDHQCILARRSEPTPACRKKIPKLSNPPCKEITKHTSSPIIRSEAAQAAYQS